MVLAGVEHSRTELNRLPGLGDLTELLKELETVIITLVSVLWIPIALSLVVALFTHKKMAERVIEERPHKELGCCGRWLKTFSCLSTTATAKQLCALCTFLNGLLIAGCVAFIIVFTVILTLIVALQNIVDNDDTALLQSATAQIGTMKDTIVNLDADAAKAAVDDVIAIGERNSDDTDLGPVESSSFCQASCVNLDSYSWISKSLEGVCICGEDNLGAYRATLEQARDDMTIGSAGLMVLLLGLLLSLSSSAANYQYLRRRRYIETGKAMNNEVASIAPEVAVTVTKKQKQRQQSVGNTGTVTRGPELVTIV